MASTAVATSNDRHRSEPTMWPIAAGGLVGGAAGLIGIGPHGAALVGPVLGALGVAAARTDLRHRRIPDRLVTIGALCAAVVAGTVEVLDGRRPGVTMLIGAGIAALPLLAVHLVTPAGIGFGDVKYAAVTGALLGAANLGLGSVAVALACLFAIGGVAAGWWPRTSIPFGACLAVSALLCLLTGRWWVA